MPVDLISYYQQQVDSNLIQENPEQKHILNILQECWLHSAKNLRFKWFRHSIKTIHVYIYGSVGSGKTYVMDLFFNQIATAKKMRSHFHAFIEYIANRLKKLQGEINPMRIIVDELAKKYKVICLDELIVQDVVQAMILRELLPALMEKGVMLVMTSNIEPQNLYLNGLQRERFMTVIEHIDTYAHVLSLHSSQDYRLEKIRMPHTTYFVNAKPAISLLFADYAAQREQEIKYQQTIDIQGHAVKAIAVTDDLIWFDFNVIVNIPRCQRDYLELAHKYKIMFITGITAFNTSGVNPILWIYLIDVFYDAHVKLVFEADVALDDLYVSGAMSVPFKRTLSRMYEMQSQAYWCN